jgi:hypothetical protein
MLVWVVLALVGAAAFVVLVLPYRQMPDVGKTPWHELARGVAPGDEGGHERDDPYFILGTNENPTSAVAAVKRRLAAEGWRAFQDPNPFGGVTFGRTDDPARAIFFEPFPGQTHEDLADYSVAPERVREWQRQYANIYVLEMFAP